MSAPLTIYIYYTALLNALECSIHLNCSDIFKPMLGFGAIFHYLPRPYNLIDVGLDFQANLPYHSANSPVTYPAYSVAKRCRLILC
jgi:hypothetical protein